LNLSPAIDQTVFKPLSSLSISSPAISQQNLEDEEMKVNSHPLANNPPLKTVLSVFLSLQREAVLVTKD
jgi:hypothetical protein